MPPPGDTVTETGLAALLLAMTKMNVACVVRFVKRKNAVPELGALFASDPADFAGTGRQISLIYTKLPVNEDMREYSFSSFEKVLGVDNEGFVPAVMGRLIMIETDKTHI